MNRIVGVVADVKRDQESDFVCRKCCVYGINEEEYNAIQAKFPINPRQFSWEANRFVVHANPWSVMRILAEAYGYHYTVTPLGGRVESATGERRTCVWSLETGRHRANAV